MLSNFTNKTFTGVIFYSYPGSKKEASENWKTNRYPDLVVDDLFLTKDHYVAVRIKNHGKKSIPEAAWKKNNPAILDIKMNDKYWGGAGMILIDPEKKLLKPGSRIIYRIRLKILKPIKIEAIIDSLFVVNESNEKNNKFRTVLVP